MDSILNVYSTVSPKYAIAHACGDLCLVAGTHLRDCVELNAPNVAEMVGEGDFATWVPEESVDLLLIKTSSTTLIYIHSCDSVFFAVAPFLLPQTCPPDTTLRGRFIMEGDIPRILVYDTVRIAGAISVGVPMTRYMNLKNEWFNDKSLVKQWCGDAPALFGSMRNGTFRPPHGVKHLHRFGEDPMLPTLVPPPHRPNRQTSIDIAPLAVQS